MPIHYVFDENLRGVPWQAVQRHNRSSPYPVDVVRVGDSADLPLATTDPDILRWAERAGRIVVTLDKSTFPVHLARHLNSGGHSPGVFTITGRVRIPTVVDFLVVAAYASDPEEWRDSIVHITA
jgi:hypothetical protein